MARPNQRAQRRLEYIPLISHAFVEVGYRRTTTAMLAERCAVRENILYRLWSDKCEMFLAALDYVYVNSEATWSRLLEEYCADDARSCAQIILDYEAGHHGEFGLYRLVFTGLAETGDEMIKRAMTELYRRFHCFIRRQVADHRSQSIDEPTVDSLAWAIMGMGTIANIGRELDLIDDQQRAQLIGRISGNLLDWQP